MMKRAIIVLVAGMVILILLGAASVQVALWSDLPRRIVESALCDATGLEITIDSLDTGWGGSTTARGFTASIPLEEQPFVEAPSVEVSHAGLIRLALTQSLDIDQITVRQPHLSIREERSGTWNLVRAIEVIEAASGHESKSGGAAAPLPAVDLVDATIDLVRHDQRKLSFDAVQLSGHPQGRFGWSFEARRSPELTASGRFMLARPLEHEITFRLQELAPTLTQWIPDSTLPIPQLVSGSWTGRISNEILTGRLHLETMKLGENEIEGDVRVRAGRESGRITMSPQSLTVISPEFGSEPVHIESGELDLDSHSLDADRILVRGREIRAMLDGRWVIDERRGEVSISWQGARHESDPPWLKTHRGSLEATLAAPVIGPAVADGQITFDVESTTGALTGTLVVSASSPDWRRATGRLEFPTLVWHDTSGVIHADELAFAAELDWPALRLTEFNIPGPESANADARVDLNDREWALTFNARSWRIPRTIDQSVDLDFDARGDLERIDFTRLHVANHQIELTASGRYMPSAADPVVATAELHVERPLELTQPASAEVDADVTPAFVAQLDSELNVRGAIRPLELAYDGQLTARDVHMGERTVAEVALPWSGRVSQTGAVFNSDTFSLLDGEWSLDGALDYRPLLLTAVLRGRDVPLDQLVATTRVPIEVSGMLGTQVNLRLPNLDPDQLEMAGDWSVMNLRTDRLSAGQGSGKMRIGHRRIDFHDIRLEQSNGLIEGSASFSLERQRELELDLTARNWPAVIEGTDLRLLLGGRGQVVIDLIEENARGDLHLETDIAMNDDPIATVVADASVDKQNIRLDSLRATTLDGEVTASGSVRMGDWLSANLDGAWDGIDLARLEKIVPQTELLHGTSSGRFSVAKATDPRALGPLRIDVQGQVADGMIGNGMNLGDFSVVAHAGADRVILEQGSIDLADGKLGLWGRSSMHDGSRYLHGQVRLANIDLNQAMHAFRTDLPETPGRLNGQVTIGTYAGEIDRTFGTGRVYLSQTDLGALPAFDLMYNLLRLDFGGGKPTGYGMAEVRIEGTTVEISKLEYFNRGTDVAGSMTVSDFTKRDGSPISGVVVGAVRPFRDLNLPLFGDLDRLVAALQSDAVAINIRGTLAEPTVRKVELAEVGTTLRRILTPGGSGG